MIRILKIPAEFSANYGIIILIGFLVIFLTLTCTSYWVSIDAKRRDMNMASWAFLVFLTGIIGVLIYLFKRKRFEKNIFQKEGFVVKILEERTYLDNYGFLFTTELGATFTCYYTQLKLLDITPEDYVYIIGISLKNCKLKPDIIYNYSKKKYEVAKSSHPTIMLLAFIIAIF